MQIFVLCFTNVASIVDSTRMNGKCCKFANLCNKYLQSEYLAVSTSENIDAKLYIFLLHRFFLFPFRLVIIIIKTVDFTTLREILSYINYVIKYYKALFWTYLIYTGVLLFGTNGKFHILIWQFLYSLLPKEIDVSLN